MTWLKRLPVIGAFDLLINIVDYVTHVVLSPLKELIVKFLVQLSLIT